MNNHICPMCLGKHVCEICGQPIPEPIPAGGISNLSEFLVEFERNVPPVLTLGADQHDAALRAKVEVARSCHQCLEHVPKVVCVYHAEGRSESNAIPVQVEDGERE